VKILTNTGPDLIKRSKKVNRKSDGIGVKDSHNSEFYRVIPSIIPRNAEAIRPTKNNSGVVEIMEPCA